MSSSHCPTGGRTRRHVQRRTVVRAAAHAAWAGPAIQMATAVPAFAVPVDTLAFTGGSARWDNTTYPRIVDVAAALRVAGASTPLRVTVTFPNLFVWSELLGIDLAVDISNVASGWRASAPTYRGARADRAATVVFTATTWEARGAVKPLAFRVTTPRLLSDTQTGGNVDTLTLRTTSTGHAPATTTISPIAG